LLPPFHQIHHHYTCVEVAKLAFLLLLLLLLFLLPAMVEDLG
jgi:hypothetical protein